MFKLNNIYIILSFIILSSSVSYGHGDLHQRILEATEMIKKDPDNLALYMKRGKLYLEHEEYDKCLKDLKRCRDGDFSEKIWLIYEARAHRALLQHEEGLNSVNAFLAQDPQNVRALRIKGNILHEYGCHDMAVEELEKVIRLSSKTLPENYLECAEALLMSDIEDKLSKTNEILELGVNQLGNIPVLYEKLVTVNLNHRDLDKAIAYQTRIVNLMNRKENALYRRAVIWLDFEKHAEAKKDLLLAKSAIDQLPERIKRNSSTTTLRLEINKKLDAL